MKDRTEEENQTIKKIRDVLSIAQSFKEEADRENKQYDVNDEETKEGTGFDALAIKPSQSSKINLKGRGLIGAGYVQHGLKGGAGVPSYKACESSATASTLRGYSNTSKNLRSIKGSGTASDLKYKQIGSKFIRVPDLRLINRV